MPAGVVYHLVRSVADPVHSRVQDVINIVFDGFDGVQHVVLGLGFNSKDTLNSGRKTGPRSGTTSVLQV